MLVKSFYGSFVNNFGTKLFVLNRLFKEQKKVEQLTNNNQNFCDGKNNLKEVNRYLDKVEECKPKGILFNRNQIVANHNDGNCTAMCLDIFKYLEKFQSRKDADALILEAGNRFDKHQGKDRKNIGKQIRNLQCALNCIECDTANTPNVDFSYKKAKSLLSSADLKTDYYSEKFNFDTDSSSKLAKQIQKMPTGVYLLRILRLNTSVKLEKWGHSLIYIKCKNSSYYYDPNLGLEKINKCVEDRMYQNLEYNFNRWKVTETRFYRVKGINLRSIGVLKSTTLWVKESTRKMLKTAKKVNSSTMALIFRSLKRCLDLIDQRLRNKLICG